MTHTTLNGSKSRPWPYSKWWSTPGPVGPSKSWALCRVRPTGTPLLSWTLSLCPWKGLRRELMHKLMRMSTWLIILRLISRRDGWRMLLGGTILILVMDDVTTQMLNQQFEEPFLAVVIDPTRTVSAGKVEIGAFRTYPEGYKPPDDPVSEYQTIPLNKIEDFGVHCKQSALDCRLLDLLWNKYWVNTLSSSPLLGNGDYVAGQISDLAEKLEQAENHLGHSRFGPLIAPPQRKKEEESQLAKIIHDRAKITVEQIHGLMSQVIKDILFNSVHQSNRSRIESSGPEPMVET